MKISLDITEDGDADLRAFAEATLAEMNEEIDAGNLTPEVAFLINKARALAKNVLFLLYEKQRLIHERTG
jgi:hypothetical protein